MTGLVIGALALGIVLGRWTAAREHSCWAEGRQEGQAALVAAKARMDRAELDARKARGAAAYWRRMAAEGVAYGRGLRDGRQLDMVQQIDDTWRAQGRVLVQAGRRAS